MKSFLRGSFPMLSAVAVLALGPGFAAAADGWKIRFDGSDSSPVIAEGVLYIGSANGALYALDPDTGDTRWRFQTGEGLPSGPDVIGAPSGGSISDQMAAGMAAARMRKATGIRRIDMSPVVTEGTVYVGSGDHFIYALDAATGRLRWSYEAGEGLDSKRNRPVVSDGVVYVVSKDGLHAVDAGTGERRWLFETLTEVPAEKLADMKRTPSAPVLIEDTLFMSAWPFRGRGAPPVSYVYAVASDTGTAKWVAALDGIDITAPVIAGGLVLVSTGATLHAIDAGSGELKWQSAEGKKLGTPRLIAVGSTVYFCTDSQLLAADLDSGRPLWHFNADLMEGDLLADDQHIYVITWKSSRLSASSSLRAVHRSTGETAWSQTLGGFQESLTMHGDVLYVSGEGSLHAVDTATGRKMWSFKAKTGLSRAVKSGDRIFVASTTVEYLGTTRVDQGYLFSIDADTGK